MDKTPERAVLERIASMYGANLLLRHIGLFFEVSIRFLTNIFFSMLLKMVAICDSQNNDISSQIFFLIFVFFGFFTFFNTCIEQSREIDFIFLI